MSQFRQPWSSQSLLPTRLKRIILYIRTFGWRRFFFKLREKIILSFQPDGSRRTNNPRLYRLWIQKNEPSLGSTTKLKTEPLISVVVPCYRTPPAFLKEMIQSVISQTYSHWELCLAIADELDDSAKKYVNELSQREPRVRVKYLSKNEGIAANTNAAIALAKGEFIALLDHDDLLAPFALREVAQAINEEPDAELIYSDEDKVSPDGRLRHSPHFKPEWSPDLLRSYNYITHLLVVKSSLLQEVGLLRSEFDGSQDYDLVLRVSEKARKIVHIPKVLYHWREHLQSTAFNIGSKPEVTARSTKAVQEHLARIGRKGIVSPGPFFGSTDTTYQLREQPKVSIIIPNHDQPELLRGCVNSIVTKTNYDNYEILIMENHSQDPATHRLYEELGENPRIRVVKWEKPFNYSTINNDAVKEATGSVLLFLNNDMEVVSQDWLEQMLQHLQYPEVGIVGAKLYYPDRTVQHAGVILGIGGIAGHSHKGFPEESDGYFGRLKVVQDLSAVTGACLMIKRETFEKVGGFDEGFPLAFNDVDLCIRVREAGKLIVWTPKAELVHHESKTRGYEDTEEKIARFKKEIDYFHKKWSDLLRGTDPYYNPNLTLESEDFSLNWK